MTRAGPGAAIGRFARRVSRLVKKNRYLTDPENADGLLSEDELKSADRGHRGHDRRPRPEPGEIVANLDADNSGGLSQAELQGKPVAPDADAFLAADRDGSGELDAEELGELFKSRHQRQPRNWHPRGRIGRATDVSPSAVRPVIYDRRSAWMPRHGGALACRRLTLMAPGPLVSIFSNNRLRVSHNLSLSRSKEHSHGVPE